MFPDQGLVMLGFTFEDNGDTDPRSHDWNIRNEQFHLWVDPWCDVFLRRLNPDTDAVQLDIDGVSELQTAIAFIQP